jgi:HSP20 family protein
MTEDSGAMELTGPLAPWRMFDWMRVPDVLEAAPLKVEEFRDGDELVVRAEMPGIDPDRDVEIDVMDHLLRIKAERRRETKIEEKDHYRSEFQYGSFTRVVPLASGASRKDVKATYHDGILEVRVPVDRQQAEQRRVPVQRV